MAIVDADLGEGVHRQAEFHAAYDTRGVDHL
jgi:hypothetical protein